MTRQTISWQRTVAPVLACVLLWGCAAGPEPASRPPNFIVIFVDDMGYGDIGPFGSTVNRTPNLDRIADEGMKLTSFYAAPLCTQSRAALLTGSYPKRVGLEAGSWFVVLMPGDEHGIHSDEVTVAEMLQSRGYRTACIGKWHLGDQAEFLPTRHGFDYYYGLPYSNDMIPDNPTTPIRNYPPLPLLRGEEVVSEVKDQSFLTGAYTEEAVRFIQQNREEPFFLYLPHTMVHVPLYAGEEFKNKSSNGVLGDTIEEIDWSTGRILDALKETGISEHTLVIFTSDNGPARGSPGPLRGRKGSTYEGGMREPTLAWWPGTIPAGSESDEVTSTMDLLPTFAGLAGAEVPRDRIIDGDDISPILRGEPGAKSPYEAFYYYFGDTLRAVRSGVWKLHANGELYHLGEDIGEQNDISMEHPDVVAKLNEYLESARADLGDGPDYPGSNCRPPGKHEAPTFLIPRPLPGDEANKPVYRGAIPRNPDYKRPSNW